MISIFRSSNTGNNKKHSIQNSTLWRYTSLWRHTKYPPWRHQSTFEVKLKLFTRDKDWKWIILDQPFYRCKPQNSIQILEEFLQKQLWTCEIEFLSLGCWVKEWLTIYYGTQSTGKNQPWNQTLWSWPLFLTFLIIRCFNLSCCVRSQFWKF